MACVCKACVPTHEPRLSSHHHCTAAPLQHSAPAQPQVGVHHCEAGHSPSHGYCPSCPPHACPGIATSHPAQCTGCSHDSSTLLSPHVNSHTCFSSPSSLPHSSHPHPHTPASHHPSPHTSHPHTPASHHPSPHTTHPHTPVSHHPSPHTSHPHTPASHHPSPHTSHPHIPTSHHPNSTSYHHPLPSPLHQPTSHLHRAPFAASPLHQTHTCHRSHSPSYLPSPRTHHETEPHSSLTGYCTSTTCRIQPPRHPKSVCQVHPTRRQLIPNSLCLTTGDNHPPTTQLASTPPQSVLHHLHTSQCNPHTPLSRPVHPLPQTPDHLPPERVQGYTAPVTVYATPPPNPSRAHLVQQQFSIDFSPNDGAVPSNSSTNFELAIPPIVNTDVPVNYVKLPEPSHLQLPNTTNNLSESSSTQLAPSSPLSTESSSLPRSSKGQSDKTLGKATKYTLPVSKKRETLNSVGASSSVNPHLSFVSDDKIGREVVVLQHCAKASWKTEPLNECPMDSVSWDEFEKKFIQESGQRQRNKTETSTEVAESRDSGMTAEGGGASRAYDSPAEVEATASNRIYTRSQVKILHSDSEMSQADETLTGKTIVRLKSESSQSESDCPNISERAAATPPSREGSGGARQSKRRKMKGKKKESGGVGEEGESEVESYSIASRLRRRCRVRPLVLETSQSESEDSVVAVPPLQLPPPVHHTTQQPSLSQSSQATAVSPQVTVGSSEREPTQTGSIVHVHLTDWYIRIVGKNLVIVEGVKNDDKRRTWHSGPIVERLAPRLVSTRSGTIYHLEGPLHRAGLEKLDIGDLIMKFEDGFPEDWLSIIHNCLLQKIKSNKERDGLRRQSREERTEPEEGDERTEDRGEGEGGEEGGTEEGEKGQYLEVKRRTSKRTKRGKKQPRESTASERHDDDDEETEREGGEGAGVVLPSTPVVPQSTTSQVTTEDETTPCTRPIKTEQDPSEFTTPQATPLDTNIASEFISSLKRSSRGRTLKPASSSFTANTSMNIYSYDMRGNFIGLSSPVIDLTITSDTSGFFTSGNVSGQQVKRELAKEGEGAEETEGEGGVEKEKEVKKKKESKAVTRVQRNEGSKEGLKKNKRRKSYSVIPSALRKTKKSTVRSVDSGNTSQEEEEVSGVSEQEAHKEKTVAEDKSTKRLASKVERKGQRSGPRDGRGDPGSESSDTTTQNGKSSNQETVAGSRRRRKKGNTAGTKKVVDGVAGSDSIITGKSGAEKDSELVTDCLVDTMETTRDNVGNLRKVKVQHKKAKRGVSISDRVVVMGEGGGERGGGENSPKEWTKTEVQKLSRVVLSVPALAENFWEVVAERVGNGHSAAECSSRYAEINRRQKRKKKAGRGTSKDKSIGPPPALTAGVGTMKRKRQVRDILDHLDSGYIDDIFNTTPFKKSKLKDKQVAGIEAGDEAEEEEDDDDHLITTPRETWRRSGAPSTSTPTLCDYGTTPDYKNALTQGVADHVMYRKEKAKKRPKPPSKLSSLSRPSPSKPRSSSTHNLHNIHSGELTVLRRFEDSDDSCDSNPFSDMEDACQDVIARLH